jgi:hypothetical protein
MMKAWSRSSRRKIPILITSWRTVDNLLQAAITSATWRHAHVANHRLYTVAWTKDSPNQTLKETNLSNLESIDQVHGLGADDAAASVISAKENTRAKWKRSLSDFVSTQLNKEVCILIIKNLHLFRSKEIFILGTTV